MNLVGEIQITSWWINVFSKGIGEGTLKKIEKIANIRFNLRITNYFCQLNLNVK